MTAWQRCCVICAARGIDRRLAEGHVCAVCLIRIRDDLDAIVRLASLASIEPRTGTGGGSRTVPASRPPIDVAGVDPALTLVPRRPAPTSHWPTVLSVLEDWERLVREACSMAPYGIASAARGSGAYGKTTVTLTGVVGFLRASLPWWAASPDQPIEDLAAEVRDCVRALIRWDPEHAPIGTMVRCPTLTEDGECGYRLHYAEPDEKVTCKRCGVTRDAMTLVTVALADGDAEVWVDGEAAQKETGVSVATLRRWTRRGILRVSHGRYDLRAIHRAVEGERMSAHLNLLRRVAGDS